MTPGQRSRRMVGYLPPVLQNGEKIRLVFDTLGQELGEMELGLTRLMRSRWYRLAQGFETNDSLANKAESELGRLGALYGLEPRRGESADYFRQRIASLVELHRSGLNSAPALLRLVSLVYLAQQPPEISWEGEDCVGRFQVPRGDGTTQPLRVVLSDKPFTPMRTRLLGIGLGQQLLTANTGLEEVIPEISFKAAEKDISIPVLHHEESGLDVMYLGRVLKGQTLLLRDQRAPMIEGLPAGAPLIVAHPTRFTSQEELGPRARFDAPGSRFAIFNKNQELPRLRLGTNSWSYKTLTRTKLASYLRGNLAQEELDKALALAGDKEEAPLADIQFDWIERSPATFTLSIPADYVPPRLLLEDQEKQVPGLAGLVRELAATLNYGRAAGVRARIELTLPMPPEAVSVRESLAQLELSLAFPRKEDAEALRVTDALTSFGPTLTLTEQVTPPDDGRLTWSGFFDHTRFDTSRFKP